MKTVCYLVVSKDGVEKAVKTCPVAGLGQIVLPLKLDLPDALFDPPLMPTVQILLDEKALPHLKAVEEAMDILSGVDVKVRLVDGTKES